MKKVKPILYSKDVLDLERARAYRDGLEAGQKLKAAQADEQRQLARTKLIDSLARLNDATAHAIQFVFGEAV